MPILLLVFVIPAAIAAFVFWRLARNERRRPAQRGDATRAPPWWPCRCSSAWGWARC
ncbi:hypothetical protein M8494_31085 [Serratia ureilytica]